MFKEDGKLLRLRFPFGVPMDVIAVLNRLASVEFDRGLVGDTMSVSSK